LILYQIEINKHTINHSTTQSTNQLIHIVKATLSHFFNHNYIVESVMNQDQLTATSVPFENLNMLNKVSLAPYL